MKLAIKDLINSTRGKYVFSILLGIGLASLFRKACESRNCMVFKAPTLDNIKNKIFGHNNKCYNFNEQSTSCTRNSNINNTNTGENITLDIHTE